MIHPKSHKQLKMNKKIKNKMKIKLAIFQIIEII